MEREAGLVGGTGLRGNEVEVRDADEGTDIRVEQAQVECVDVRRDTERIGGRGACGDSATWGRGNIDVEASLFVPALL